MQFSQFGSAIFKNVSFSEITQKQTTFGLLANLYSSIEDIKFINFVVPRTALGPAFTFYGLNFMSLVMNRVVVEN